MEQTNTLRNRTLVQLVDLVSEGEIEGLVNGEESIYFGEVPYKNADGTYNFTNVSWSFTPGTRDQAALSGMPLATNEFSVGQIVKKATPYTFTVNDTEIDIIRVRLGFPNLSQQRIDNGDLVGAELKYSIEVRSLPSGAWQPVLAGLAEEKAEITPPTAPLTGAHFVRVTVKLRSGYRETLKEAGERLLTVKGRLASTITVEKRVNGGSWTAVEVRKVAGSHKDLNYTFETSCLPTDTVEMRSSAVCAQSPYDVAPSIVKMTTKRVIADAVVTLKDKTTSRYERAHTFEPLQVAGAGPWQVRITRITDDSTSSYLQNNLEVAGYSEIQTEKFRYPYSALMAIEVDAEQFSSVPTRGYHMRYMIVNVPSNYDPITREYTGMWDGTFKRAWTNCPPWILYDIITNKRFGLGNRIEPWMLDKALLYKIGQYCDELVPNGYGDAEPRFTCNVYLQEQQEAAKLLTDLASVFFSMAYYSSAGIHISQDAPRDPVYLFTNANVVDGFFEYSSVEETARCNTVKVSWNDPNDMYRQKVEYVSDPELVRHLGYVRDTETVAFGCTSRAQARRAGRHTLFTNYYGSLIAFKVGVEGAIPKPGDVILVQDSLRAGEHRAGRLQAVSGAVLTLDQAINVPVGSELTVIDPTAGLQTRTVVSVSGKNVTVASAFNPQPNPDTLYTVAASDIQPQKFQVLSVAEDEKHEYSVSGMLHLDSKFSYISDDADLVFPDTSNADLALKAPPPPTNIAVSDTLYYGPGGTLKSKILLSWTPPDPVYGVRAFQVSYRKEASGWVTLAQTSLPSEEILDVTDGMLYEIRVTSINALGLTAPDPDVTTYTPVGLKAPPTNVTGFTQTVDPQLGTLLRWSPVSDLDVSHYEIRKGASWAAGTLVARIKATEYRLGFDLSATLWIKAVDSSGNESVSATSQAVSLTAPPAQTVSSSLVGKTLTLSWAGSQGSFNIGYAEISATGFTTQTVKGSAFTLDVNWTGSKTFTVKLYDLGGNAGAAATKAVSIATPTAPTVSSSFEGDNAVLSWGAVAGSLPTAYYNVRRNGVVIATIQGTRWSQRVDWAGSVTYSVAAVDQNGNIGTYGSVTPTVTNPPAPTVAGSVAGKTLTLTWSAVQGSLPVAEYEISAPGMTTQRVKGTSLNVDVDWFGAKTFSVVAYDTADNAGSVGQYTSTVVASAAPNVSSNFVGDNVLLGWNATAGTLPTAVYQISKEGVVMATIQGTTWSQKADWVGSKLFEVAAVDVNGNVGARGSATPNIAAPSTPAVQQEVIDNNVLLRWSDATATLPVATYEIRRGTDWATAKVVGKTLSRFSALFESVAGNFTYLVGAYDTAGNLGSVGSVSAVVSQPPDYALQLDFNSSLNGTLVSGKVDSADGFLVMPLSLTETFEKHFERGLFASPSAFGDAVWTKSSITISSDATTAPDGSSRADKLVETASTAAHSVRQTYGSALSVGQAVTVAVYAKTGGAGRKLNLLGTYAVFGSGTGATFDLDTGTVINTVGNASNVSITSVGSGWHLCRVTFTASAAGTPELYFGLSNSTAIYPSYLGDGAAGVFLWGAQVVAGSNYLAQWFSPADQVAAGFAYGAQPSASSGYYEETLDYGTVLAATKISVTPTVQTISGTPSYTITISARASTLDAWTDYPNQDSVYATNFRYVKVKIDVTSADGKGLLKVQALNIRLDAKLKNDAGSGVAAAADSGGTQVFFNIPFVDVHAITVTAQGTTAVTAIYDFVDAPNPTGFKVLLFNSAGTRVSGNFSWSVKGV